MEVLFGVLWIEDRLQEAFGKLEVTSAAAPSSRATSGSSFDRKAGYSLDVYSTTSTVFAIHVRCGAFFPSRAV